jgi:hypothetical protein
MEINLPTPMTARFFLLILPEGSIEGIQAANI